MKICVSICLVLAVCQASLVFGAAAPPITDTEATNLCIKELKLAEPTLKTFDSLNDASNDDFNNLLSCSWKKLGFQKEDGKIVFPELIDYLTEFCEKRAAAAFSVVPNKTVVEGWLENCRDLQGDNHGKIAANVHFCLSSGIDKFKETHKKTHNKV